jgi:histidine triad (HIT) family protein
MMEKEDCIFCKIVRGEIKSEIVKSSNSCIAIRDIHPVAEGHTLVIVKQHFGTLLDMPNRLGEELVKFTKEVASDMLDKKLGDGFNIVMNNLPAAGQEIMHAHFHVIPRKEGDGIRWLTRAGLCEN